MKKLLILCLIPIIFFFNNENIYADSTLASNSKSAILIEESSGKILYEKNINDQLIPASMTKIMSMILICEKLDSGNITLDDKVTVSANAASMGGSQVFLEQNEVFTVDEMLKCIAIVSANDACVAMSEFIYGSESEFVRQMNLKAESLGLENTNFIDCTGLTDVNHYSSAYDMAMMSMHLLNNYKDIIIPYTSMYEDYIREDTDDPFWLVATNKLVKYVDGIDGLKTGYISTGGYCMSCTMEKDGMRLISVVMGYSTSSTRNAETVELLNYGFANYKSEVLIEKDTIIKEYSSILYKTNNFNLIVEADITRIKSKSDSETLVRYEILSEPTVDNSYGLIKVYCNDEEIGTYNVLFDQELEKRTFFELMFEVFKVIIS